MSCEILHVAVVTVILASLTVGFGALALWVIYKIGTSK